MSGGGEEQGGQEGRGEGEGRSPRVRLRSEGVGMEEAASEEYLRQKWAQKRPGYLAGKGESVQIDAQETLLMSSCAYIVTITQQMYFDTDFLRRYPGD